MTQDLLAFHVQIFALVSLQCALCVGDIGLRLWHSRGLGQLWLLPIAAEAGLLAISAHYLLAWPVEPVNTVWSRVYWSFLLCAFPFLLYRLGATWRPFHPSASRCPPPGVSPAKGRIAPITMVVVAVAVFTFMHAMLSMYIPVRDYLTWMETTFPK